MIELIAVEAAYGDCLLLRWNVDKQHRFILIDGGPTKSYAASLDPTLKELGVTELQIVINSHVDSDHIGGLKALFSTLVEANIEKSKDAKKHATPAIVELWHNQFSKTIDVDGEVTAGLQSLANSAAASVAGTHAAAGLFVVQSIKEGEQLVKLAKKMKVPVNRANYGKHFLSDNGGFEYRLERGVTIDIVGPTEKNIENLRKKWKKYLADAKKKPATSAIAATGPMSDNSVPNLSSIQMLVSHEGRRILLTGDGLGDDLVEGLRDAGLLDADGGIDVDVFKVPHHGSDRNLSPEFFETVRANKYVISADGRYDNPSAQALRWIYDAAKKQKREGDIELYFTNESDQLEEFRRGLPAKAKHIVKVRDKAARYVVV